VAQEALANIARHSHATSVEAHVVWERDRLVAMTIQDDGRGFDVDRADGRGTGLWSMRQRIAAVGGKVRIVSSSSSGTRVDVYVPLGPDSDRWPVLTAGAMQRGTEPLPGIKEAAVQLESQP
jgi:signal transduction histidine kinase